MGREMEGEEEPLKGESRGVKRRHHPDTECTDSCDCEEFGLPLAKRIHGLNLLQTKGDCRTEGSGETEKVNESGSSGGPVEQFGTVYPFPQGTGSQAHSVVKFLKTLILQSTGLQ